MGTVARQLEQVNQEIAAQSAEVKAAKEAWLNAEALQKKADLKEVYEDAKEKQKHLLQDRQALYAMLSSPGVAESKWDKDGRCEALSKFVLALEAVKAEVLGLEADTVITLKDGAIWLGMDDVASSDLFVRGCYIELFQARDAYIKARGVGKTHGAALFVAQQLLSGHDVLLERRIEVPDRSQRHYFWITTTGNVEHTKCGTEAEKRLTRYKGHVMYVTDGCLPGISRDIYNCPNVTFCSPQKDLWRGEKKAWPYMLLFVPVVAAAEMLDMKAKLPEYQGLSDESVMKWHAWAGGVARACLLKNKAGGETRLQKWIHEVNSMIRAGQSTADLLRMIRCDGMDSYEQQSDLIFHWHLVDEPPAPESTSPADPKFRRYTRKVVRFASEMIKAKALVTLDISKLADVALNCLNGSPESTGYWLELMAFRCLQEGCQLKGALLPQQHSQRRKPFKINVPAATVQHWSAPEEAAAQSQNDMSVLCLPHSKSEPAIDAISSPALYWQVTKAKRHGINRSAVTKLDTATRDAGGGREKQLQALQKKLAWEGSRPMLTKPLLCFLVPPARYLAVYKTKQQYKKDGGGRHDRQTDVVHQAVVELPLQEIIDKSSSPGAREAWDKNLEELVLRIPDEAIEVSIAGAGEPAEFELEVRLNPRRKRNRTGNLHSGQEAASKGGS